MKYSYKDAIRMFNCSKKDVIRALNKYGYFSKKSIIDDKCIEYLGKFFDYSQNVDLDRAYNKANSLEDVMKIEFAKDCRLMLNNLESTEENF